MSNKMVIVIILVLLKSGLAECGFTPIEILQGYKQDNGIVIFVFDEGIYNVSPERVSIEGSFRGWEHDMTNHKWLMKKSEKHETLWLLESHHDIEPGAQFKFRIDTGEWMPPPLNSPNAKGGNLIFAYDLNPVSMRSEIVSEEDIRMYINGPNIEISLTWRVSGLWWKSAQTAAL